MIKVFGERYGLEKHWEFETLDLFVQHINSEASSSDCFRIIVPEPEVEWGRAYTVSECIENELHRRTFPVYNEECFGIEIVDNSTKQHFKEIYHKINEYSENSMGILFSDGPLTSHIIHCGKRVKQIFSTLSGKDHKGYQFID